MKQSLRFASLEKFRSLKSKILVTTDLANRGLDLPQVDLIINYNCPKSAIVYVHRVGRTCRKPDFKYQSIDMPNDQNLSIDEEVNQQINDTKSIKKSKKDNNNKFKLKKKSQNCLSSKYLGKSITFVTQYDINLFKSIENFIGIKMDKEVIDEKSVTTIIKQVSVAIKEAEIRIEHEEQESKHIENKNRDKLYFKNKKIKTM
jgi:superfamily II DNA/RNA helicase